MSDQMSDHQSDSVYNVGTWVGRKQAFSALAGRCSAADAECLRQIRDRKEYRALGLSWREFCKLRVGVTSVSANRVIGLLEEFGPQYFILAQATGISADQYRRISSSVKDQKLLHAGEEIPIDAEHATQLAAAVEDLRRGTRASNGASAGDAADIEPAEAELRVEIDRAFERASRGLKLALNQFQRLLELHRDGRSRMRLTGELGYAVGKLKELEQASWSS